MLYLILHRDKSFLGTSLSCVALYISSFNTNPCFHQGDVVVESGARIGNWKHDSLEGNLQSVVTTSVKLHSLV